MPTYKYRNEGDTASMPRPGREWPRNAARGRELEGGFAQVSGRFRW